MRHLTIGLTLILAHAAAAQSLDPARWIWGGWAEPGARPAGETCVLRRTLVLTEAPRRAAAVVTADNHFRLLVNGELAGASDDWAAPARLDLAKHLRAGENLIEAECWNDSAPAGFLFAAEIDGADGTRSTVVSDARWQSAPDRSREWTAARELGAYGVVPWGRIGSPAPSCRPDPLPGFRVVTVAEGFGSIDAFARGERGQLFCSVEGGGIVELVDRDGDGVAEERSIWSDAVSASQGMLWHEGALLATGNGPAGHGLYRVPRMTQPAKPATADAPAAPALPAPELIVAFAGDLGEHGPHCIVAGPDGGLYVAIGNHARLARPPGADSPYRITYEGHLLPHYVDPRGHAVDCKAPGGTIVRVDPATGDCRLFAAGFRNHYDLAFDESGNLFTYDSDMEWDVGLPWYRAVRLVHVVPGGEYGWRTGTICWPDWYADSLPPALETGRGSPTGMCLCTGDRFPARFRGALLAGDWSLGRIFAFRLEPRGASFVATSEVLLSGQPLNVTDLEMDEDGSLLFSVGGRGTQGGILRLIHDGPSEPPEARPAPAPAAAARIGEGSPKGALLAAIAADDRFVRFAAARELERRDPAGWEEEALALASPLARAEALVALARGGIARGDARRLAPRLAAAAAIVTGGATGAARLTALRAIELLLLDPEVDPASAPLDGAPLLAAFPCGDRAADRELAQVAARLQPPGTAERLWRAYRDEPSREQRIAYAYALRCVRGPWPEGARLELCRWLERESTARSVGMSFEGYLRRTRDDVAAGLTPEEQATLAAEAAAARAAPPAAAAPAAAEPRDLDRTVEFVARTLAAPRRSLADGALVYQEACGRCHLRNEVGANVGPDLTTAGARFGLRDLLETMIVPSRTISDQYRGLNVFLADGDIVTGLPLLDDGRRLVLVDTSGARVEIPADRIASRRPASKSVMPDGLLDPLTLEQVADLCAWILSPAPVAAPAEPSWRPLFDRRSLAGLEGDPSHWRVEEGVIVGRAEGLAAPSRLLASGAWSDFVLEFDLRLGAPDQLTGLLFRGRDDGRGGFAGYRAGAGERLWGTLLEEGGRGVVAPVKDEIWWPLPDLSGWNHYVVAAVGPRVTIELNGTVTVDLSDPEGAAGGRLGFELPAGARGELRIKNLRVLLPDVSR